MLMFRRRINAAKGPLTLLPAAIRHSTSSHSTTTALVKVTDDIRKGMETQHFTLLVLLDFSNAFGSVDFDIILAALRSLNISTQLTGFVVTYLDVGNAYKFMTHTLTSVL